MCFPHLHHFYQHGMYFLGRKTSKTYTEYTLWGEKHYINKASHDGWLPNPQSPKIYIAPLLIFKHFIFLKMLPWLSEIFLLFTEKSEKFLPVACFLYFYLELYLKKDSDDIM